MSCVPPAIYSTRFMNFMNSNFIQDNSINITQVSTPLLDKAKSNKSVISVNQLI